MKLLIFLTAALVAAQVVNGRNDSPSTEKKITTKTGPEPGEIVPEFTLPDQYGQQRSLKELLGPKGALINFYRSASW